MSQPISKQPISTNLSASFGTGEDVAQIYDRMFGVSK